MKRISATLPGRVLALLLTLCLLFTAGAVTAFADEEYPYQYPAEGDKPYYELSMLAYEVDDGTSPPDSYYYGGVHRLLDAQGKQWLAYCADSNVTEKFGSQYKAVPLSELETTQGSEKKLRAIIQNSYPFITKDEMIQRMEAAGVTLNNGLSPCYEMVLISAVHQAIYSYTNPDLKIKYSFASAYPWSVYDEQMSPYVLNFNEAYQYYDGTADNWSEVFNAIKADVPAVMDWLNRLPEQDAPTVTVDTTFDARIETAGEEYSLQLFGLSADLQAAVDLNVAVTANGEAVYTGPVTLVADGTFQVAFSSEKLTAGTEVTVELTGGKLYDDVVGYQARTEDNSQPFIGNGQLTKPFTAQKIATIPAKVSVPVQKVWNDDKNADGIRPASVTVHLLADGKDTDKTLTMDASNDWKGTFEDLDATVGGVNINYTVKEDPVTGYDSVVEGSMTDGFKITNTSRGAIFIRPADITIYMGGEEGYDAVVGTGNELLDTNNSLPLPLFHIEAPTGVKPENLTFISSDVIPGTGIPKKWSVSVAGETREGKTLYYLNKENDAQDDVRIQYTNNDSAITSDQFDPNEVKDLYLDYTAKLYTGTVNVGGVRAVDTTDNKDYGLCLGEGTLRVRAVEDGSGTPDTNPVYPVQNEEPATKLPANTAAVVAEQGTKYRLNHTTVKVEAKGVGLLFDDIYDKDNGQGQREKTLIACSDKAIGPAASNVIRYHQAKYLDLVDQNNGNAWVQTMDGKSVKVVWAYPEGTDKNTKFTLLHFEGLHRDDADDASSGYETTDIETVTPEIEDITNTDAGITFEVSSGGFSPFVLIWEKAKPAPEKEEESTTPAATPKPTPAPAKEAEPAAAPAVTTVAIPQTGDDSQPLVWVALVVLSGAVLAGLAVYRKKRSDK